MGKQGLKRIIASATSAALVSALVPTVPAVAATSSSAEYEDQGFKYVIDADGTAGVEGVVDTSVTSISVPEELGGHTVARVSSAAFVQCRSLEEILLPKTLSKIKLSNGGYAGLWNIYKVKRINVDPECESFCSVNGVLYSADKTKLVSFPGAHPITDYSVPEGVTTIAPSGFQSAQSLVSVSLPSTLSGSMGNPFVGCESLASITVSAENRDLSSASGVMFNKRQTKLASYPIAKRDTSYSIPSSVTSLIETAMNDLAYLEKVTVPASVKLIEQNNFTNCPNLCNITVSKSNSAYVDVGGVLLDKKMKTLLAYPTGLDCSHYIIPPTVTTLSPFAIANTKVEAISVPSSVKSFGTCCLFSYFTSRIYVETKMQLSTLSDSKGSYVYSADRIILTEAKTGIVDGGEGEELVIGESMPVSCAYGEAHFTLLKEEPPVSTMSLTSRAASTPSYAGEVRVDYYPTGKSGIVNLKSLRYNFKNYKVVQVAPSAFKNRKDVASVTLGEWVTAVGAGAFQGCKNLKTVSLGARMRSIGSKAFMSCKSMKAVSLKSKTVKTVGSGAFKGTPAKTLYKLPKAKLKAYKKLLIISGAGKKATYKKA